MEVDLLFFAYNKSQKELVCIKKEVQWETGERLSFLITELDLVIKFHKGKDEIKVLAYNSVQTAKRDGKEIKSENNFLH